MDDPYLPRYTYTIQVSPFVNMSPIYGEMSISYHPSYGYVPPRNSASIMGYLKPSIHALFPNDNVFQLHHHHHNKQRRSFFVIKKQ